MKKKTKKGQGSSEAMASWIIYLFAAIVILVIIAIYAVTHYKMG